MLYLFSCTPQVGIWSWRKKSHWTHEGCETVRFRRDQQVVSQNSHHRFVWNITNFPTKKEKLSSLFSKNADPSLSSISMKGKKVNDVVAYCRAYQHRRLAVFQTFWSYKNMWLLQVETYFCTSRCLAVCLAICVWNTWKRISLNALWQQKLKHWLLQFWLPLLFSWNTE